MASMRYERDRQRQGYRIQFHVDRERYSLWLGDTSNNKATNAKRNIEELVEARRQACRPDALAVKWAVSVDARIQKILLKSGLLDEQTKRDIQTKQLKLADYLQSVIDAKPNVSDSWRINYGQAKAWLFDWPNMSRDKLLADLATSECEQWHEWMLTKLAPSTAGQHLRRIRQLLKAATKDRLIPTNPMEGIRTCGTQDRSKNAYIDEASTSSILKACDCQQWRVIIALSRIAGMRCPSEVFALKWSDIHWDAGTFVVTSRKGAKAGKGQRTVPLFPAVRRELQALHDKRMPGVDCPVDSYVVSRYRDNTQNLRTQLNRIFGRADVPVVAKPFMNFRASARKDLQRQGFEVEQLNAWLGHSTAVAVKHYGRTSEEDIKRAGEIGGVCGGVDTPSQCQTATPPSQQITVFPGQDTSIQYTQMDSNH